MKKKNIKSRKLKVLMFFADSLIGEMYQNKFSEYGFNSKSYNNYKNPYIIDLVSKEKPDILLCDILMPNGEIDGFDAIKLLKQNDQTKDIPILIVTNLATSADQEMGLKLGAAEYLIMAHYDPDQLVKKIKNYLDMLSKQNIKKNTEKLINYQSLPVNNKKILFFILLTLLLFLIFASIIYPVYEESLGIFIFILVFTIPLIFIKPSNVVNSLTSFINSLINFFTSTIKILASLGLMIGLIFFIYDYSRPKNWTLYVYKYETETGDAEKIIEGYKTSTECLEGGYKISNNGTKAFECGFDCKLDTNWGLNICKKTCNLKGCRD